MGELAEILRANLRELAHSHARTLRGIDSELEAAREEVVAPSKQYQADLLRTLIGTGTFLDQYKKTLQDICRENGLDGVKRFSRLNKPELAALLQEKGIKPPPKPLEKLPKKELVSLVKELMGMLINKAESRKEH